MYAFENDKSYLIKQKNTQNRRWLPVMDANCYHIHCTVNNIPQQTVSSMGLDGI